MSANDTKTLMSIANEISKMSERQKENLLCYIRGMNDACTTISKAETQDKEG